MDSYQFNISEYDAETWRAISMLDQEEAVEYVLAVYFTQTANGWRHERCDAEIARAKQSPEQARMAAWRECMEALAEDEGSQP